MFSFYLGKIIFAFINAPGSWHDSRIARELYQKLLHKTPDGFFLAADTAFPRTNMSIDGKIRAAPKKNEVNRIHANLTEHGLQEFNTFNRQLLSFRQAAEWGMRDIQGSFGRTWIPLPIADSALRFKLLKVISRLEQLRIMVVGINHIQNTYVPIWQDGDESLDVWVNWERMLFSDMRKKDRVSRFYNVQG